MLGSGLVLLLGVALGLACAAEGQDAILPLAPAELRVALVEDPDFPPLDDALVERAIQEADAAFRVRFGASIARFSVVERFSLDRFVDTYIDVRDPLCRDLLEQRYRGGGVETLRAFSPRAIEFLERWPLESLVGFVSSEREQIRTHADLFEVYAQRYVETVARLASFSTPAGSPLVEFSGKPGRSFAGWVCALSRQSSFDVIMTNTFVLADLMTEPHPHAALGKAKIGGIAAPSAARKTLDGQAVMVSSFGIDTVLPALSELAGSPATFEERAAILGNYLLAHEVAHAFFGIPDVYDHPPGCLMTSRPDESYRDGLASLEAHRVPCPECRPYVELRFLLEVAEQDLAAGRPAKALRSAREALALLPERLHGGPRRGIGRLSLLFARAHLELGEDEAARGWAQRALDVEPRSASARAVLRSLDQKVWFASGDPLKLLARSSTTATSSVSR